MKKSNSLRIERISHEGRGIAKQNGKTVFIENALPKETVKVTLLRSHKHYDEAIATQISNDNENRITAACPHILQCGGCNLQHLNTSNQLKIKQKALQELLTANGITPLHWLDPITSESWNYRHRAKLTVKHKRDGSVSFGYLDKTGAELINIERCPILACEIDRIIPPLRIVLSKLKSTNTTHVDFNESEDRVTLIWATRGGLHPQDVSLIQGFSDEYQTTVIIKDGGTRTHVISALPFSHLKYALPHQTIDMHYQPEHFTQVNRAINEKMIDRALELLEPKKTDRVLDLFCGIGNLTLPFAKHVEHIIGIDGCRSSIKQAGKNATNNHIENAEFVTDNLFKPSKNTRHLEAAYDVVLLDPPRAGAKTVLTHIKDWSAEKILYISCKPSTLARDLKQCHEHGYAVTNIGLLDMFPQTQHVETMAILTKR